MKTVLVVMGTRPEAIKLCPVVLELRKREEVRTVVLSTGQHGKLLTDAMACFGISADETLPPPPAQTGAAAVMGHLLGTLDAALERLRPDFMIVQGDTASAFAGALAGFYRGIPIAHVEAGLRTYNLASPYPEEFNRQAVGIVARYHFAPTELSRQNLLREGKKPNHIFVTGNTAIDALKTTVRREYTHPELEWAKGCRLILLTAHRRENLGEPMRRMFRAIKRMVDEQEDLRVVYPIHMNPAVRSAAAEVFGNDDRFHIIEPLDVLDFHNLMAHSYLILTDSGGIQEEAPALGKPVLVMRRETERPEAVAAGTAKLAGVEKDVIVSMASELLENPEAYARMAKAVNPYGDGHASARIADAILWHFGMREEKPADFCAE